MERVFIPHGCALDLTRALNEPVLNEVEAEVILNADQSIGLT